MKSGNFRRIRIDDDPYYNNVTRLNNELTNIQRTLMKRTADLERKTAELQEQSKELEHLNKLKNEMMGMAAHDLRSPLSTIMALSELLTDDDDDRESLSENQTNFIRDIHRASQFMLTLINQMLDLSQIEAGSISMDTTDIDLVKHLKRSITIHNMMAAKKRITIRFGSRSPATGDSAAMPPTVGTAIISADANKFEQIINNLLSNAIKYSPEKTTVTVSVEYCASPGKFADGQPFGSGDLLIHFQDQGYGISSENQKKLFKPFSKLSNTIKSKEKSTGLGLAITGRIVEAHGWSIHLKSEIGTGSVFTIRIPAKLLPEP